MTNFLYAYLGWLTISELLATKELTFWCQLWIRSSGLAVESFLLYILMLAIHLAEVKTVTREGAVKLC